MPTFAEVLSALLSSAVLSAGALDSAAAVVVVVVSAFEELAVSLPEQPAIAVHIAKAAMIVTIFLFIIFCLRKITRITRLTQPLTRN